MPSYEIRSLETLDEYRECVALQERVWGAGFSERVPVAILKVARRLGGVAAGAFDAHGTLAGFVFGMTGLEDGAVVHWSDMLAVRPDLRDAGLGTRLKSYQRRVLLKRGIRRVYWTFDPLESRNAYLNLAKLGIVVREYQENMYGETDSPLHRGIGTDRFVALWLLDTDRVRDRLAGEARPPGLDEVEAVAAFPVREEGGIPVPGEPDVDPGAGRLLVPIPAAVQEVKERSPDTAVAWRKATRAVLRERLRAGWEVRELICEPGSRLSHYLLARTDDRGRT